MDARDNTRIERSFVGTSETSGRATLTALQLNRNDVEKTGLSRVARLLVSRPFPGGVVVGRDAARRPKCVESTSRQSGFPGRAYSSPFGVHFEAKGSSVIANLGPR